MEEQRNLEDKEVATKGLTWRTVLAFIFIIFIIQPAIVYNWLVNGLWGLGFGYGVMSWTVILLWVGLSRLWGTALSSKEIFIIRIVESIGLMNTGYYFAYLLRNEYFANSEIARIYGVQQAVPPFYSPIGADAQRIMLSRTFFDPAWALPILASVCVPVLLSAVANYALGLLAYSLYVREEKLAFPVASWDARTIKAFGERQLSNIRIIALAVTGGVLYGFATNGLTSIIGIPLVPRYPIDLTSMIENVLPGASFSFSLDITPYIWGFIFPLEITAAQFLLSAVIFLVANPVITMNNLWPAESQWVPGQGVLWMTNMSSLYFWNSFAIGWGLALATIPLLIGYKTVIRAFRGLGKSFSGASEWWLNGRNILLIYVASASAAIILTMILVPGFPIWISVVFTLGVSFVITLLQTSTAGVTIGANVPYLRETMIYYSGYRGLDIWFTPTEMFLFLGGSNITQQLLMSSMIDEDVKEYTKAYFILVVLGLVGSLIFVSVFWRLNPIPGWAYTYTISGWPVEAMNFWRWQSWLWTGNLFGPKIQLDLGIANFPKLQIPYFMATGFSISTVLFLISDLILHKPYLPIAMLAAVPPAPYAAFNYILALFIGSLISHIIGRTVGREFWDSNKGFLAFGVLIGDGVVTSVLMIASLLNKSTWLLPY
jgi:hypothetical protein